MASHIPRMSRMLLPGIRDLDLLPVSNFPAEGNSRQFPPNIIESMPQTLEHPQTYPKRTPNVPQTYPKRTPSFVLDLYSRSTVLIFFGGHFCQEPIMAQQAAARRPMHQQSSPSSGPSSPVLEPFLGWSVHNQLPQASGTDGIEPAMMVVELKKRGVIEGGSWDKWRWILCI